MIRARQSSPRLLTTLGVAVLALVSSSTSVAADDDRNVCAQQISDIVSERFGHTVKSIEFRYMEQKSLDSIWNVSQAIVLVNECPGYHFFEINGDDFTCERQAHIGKVPIYVWYRSSGEGC